MFYKNKKILCIKQIFIYIIANNDKICNYNQNIAEYIQQKGEFPKIYNYDLEMIKKKDSFIEGKLINWY